MTELKSPEADEDNSYTDKLVLLSYIITQVYLTVSALWSVSDILQTCCC